MFRRRLGKALLGGVIVVPSVSAASLYAYVSYRTATKPLPYTPRILVHADGNLIELGGEVIRVHPIHHGMRMIQLTFMYLPLLALYYVIPHRMWLRCLLFMVQHSGPAIVKAGQWACTRYDMFSPEFREVFGVLYSDVHIHDAEHSRATIASEMKSVEEIFSFFDPVPIGSGSIGQCHSAIMRATGQKVAVKVMHPNVVRDISRDIYLINLAARFVDRWVPAVDYMCLPDTALAWTNHLAAQIDFRVEAENLIAFNDNFRDFAYVEFPTPVAWTKQVLIESFAEGEHATEAFLSKQSDNMKDKLCVAGMNGFCKMLLRDNFIHCDTHPGNVIISTATDPPKLTLIDAGLVQRMGETEAKMSNDLMSGFCYWDPELIAKTFLSMGSKQNWCDKDKYVREMVALLGTAGEHAILGDVLKGCFDVIRENKVQMDPPYVNLMFSVLVMESFGMMLNPMFNVAANSAPWLVLEGHVGARVWKSLVVTTLGQMKRYVIS